MDEKRIVKISKYLSKHLRHAPQAIGLQLQPGGWVAVDELLRACARHNFLITRAQLEEVVAKNNKQRFAFDETSTRIRANQGHSVAVDLQLAAATPPAVLYHGTAQHNVEIILRDGLQKMRRHHVHLSSDTQTAHRVGARHGRPVVLQVDAQAMHNDGFSFWCSENGVWLVNSVPPQYLRVMQ
ncbi:MAG TPA: RNA 2'-phosphotransferase [Abditibacteriaceae bacterium]|jgi:putative RNA 2'-phosphotransferase